MNFSKKNKAGSSAAGDCNKCQKIEKKLEEAKKRLKKKLAKLNSLKKLAAKKLAKKVATLPLKAVPILGWAMAAYDVYDLVTTGIDVSDLVEAFNKEADIVNKLHEKFEECLGEKKGNGCVSKTNTDKLKDEPYKPDQELPKDKHGHKTPDSDLPHTQLGTKKGRKGDYRQSREWGEKNDRGYDGKTPKKDIDWTDHGRKNHTNPHEHKYNPDTGKRN